MPSFLQFPEPPQADHDHVVAVTRLEARSPTTTIALLRRLPAVTAQMRGADGLVGYGLRAQLLRMTFWTYGVFEDRRALAAFISQGAHREAMESLGGRLRGVRARTTTRPGDALPRTWPEIAEILASPPAPVPALARRT